LADWHPISLAVQTGPNEWTIRNPRSTDYALGRIHRIEFGLYREVWFRAAVLEHEQPRVLRLLTHRRRGGGRHLEAPAG
jgi:hypothetical protein